jgi:acyl-coenzyme A synthetase/AMP-(fatty) acid ligase
VRLSYTNVASNAQAIIDALGLRPTDIGITSLSSDYSFGLSVVNTHLFAGAPLVVSRLSPTSREFWRLVNQAGVTDFGAVPLSYRLLHSTNWHAGRFPQLRLAYQAGGALEPELVAHFSRMMPFCTMYGATEATARMACLPPQLQADHLGSVGRPVPGGRIRLEDGEIVYQGPNVMMGYGRSRSDLAEGDIFGDALHTGDLGRIDRGMLYVLGRKDRQLKLHGKKIAAEDVEQRFAPVGSAAVVTSSAEAAVVFVEGSATAFRPVWFEVLRSLELPAECLRLRPVARLPRTRAGKVDFGALRELVVTP